jgi:undecaprenyl-diphosphatase
VGVDRHISAWVVRHRVDWLDWLFVALSRLGTGGFVWIVLTAVLMVASRRRRVAYTVFAVVLADVLALAVKAIVNRPRPHIDPLVRVPTDWSFPSGHAATSFAGATMLSLFFPRLAPVLYGLAVAIAFSRVYVGVHYPLDVAAGAVLGTAVGWGVFRALPRLERFLRRRPAAPPPG